LNWHRKSFTPWGLPYSLFIIASECAMGRVATMILKIGTIEENIQCAVVVLLFDTGLKPNKKKALNSNLSSVP